MAVIVDVASKAIGFISRQKRDFKVTITRQAGHWFLYQMTLPYLSIYIVALGASKLQLGLINSIGLGVSAVASAFAGWLVDRYGVKRIYLSGIAMLVISSLVYALARDWTVAILAMLLFYIGFRTTGTSCGVVCAGSLPNEDRATGMNLCNAYGSIFALIGPMVGAVVVTAFGGVNAVGIRPLYYISVAGYILLFLFVAKLLVGSKGRELRRGGAGFIENMTEVFRYGTHLKRWLIVSGLVYLQWTVLPIFAPLFAHEIKGAEQYVLGGMATAMALVSMLFGIPAGRLADRIGRKKVLYLLSPLYYASIILLILAPSPPFLVAAGAFQGFFMIGMTVSASVSAELVPLEQMGRWMGVLGFSRGLISVPGPLLGGIIWGVIRPEYLFLGAIALDLLIRIPLLISMPETLGMKRPTVHAPDM